MSSTSATAAPTQAPEASEGSAGGPGSETPRPRPRVWVLLGKGAGGNGQLRSVADALGWPYRELQLVHNPLQVIPNVLLGASRISVDGRRSDPLEPPWPDLVIAAGRRSAPVARWIRARSGGRTALVHLLQAQAPLHHFDLVLTLPQYRLPERDNVLCLTGALNRIDPSLLAEADVHFRARFESLPRPWVGVVVGGDSSSYRFDPDTAARLGREASDVAREAGGALLVSTTPRTPADSADALFEAIDVPHFAYRWQPDDPENPYHGFLALCDRFIVTVDSASLPIEACATGKPVQVFEWPRRGGDAALRPLTGLRGWLFEAGIIKPARDFAASYRVLRERGLVTRLGDPELVEPKGAPEDLERAVERIRALLGRGGDAA